MRAGHVLQLVKRGVITFITVSAVIFFLLGVSWSDFTSFMYKFGIPGVLVTMLIVSFLQYTYVTHKAHKAHEGYPGPERESFFTGNYNQMREAQNKNQLFELLAEWVRCHGDTFVFWRHESPKFFTTDPDVIKSMLTEITIFKKADSIPNRTLFGQRITGTSSFLTVSEGQLWAQKRKVMSSYFTKIHMATMYDKMRSYIDRGLDQQFGEISRNPRDTPVDLVEFYGELFQFFLGALGCDLDCDLVSGNAKFHNDIIQKILKWVPQQFRPYHEYLKLRMQPEVGETIEKVIELRKIANQILTVKRNSMKEKGFDPNDIVHHIIKGNSKTPKKDPSQEMDDMMTLFLVIDNMAKTLATFFVRVIRMPEIYTKIMEEVRGADLSSLQTMDKSLRYTEMAILECLRLHPTLMRGIRIAKKDVNLNNGMKVRAKSLIFFGQLILHKNPKYWSDPEEFIPERFAQGSATIAPFTYLPFVAGPRVCMGKHLAMLSMKLSIVGTLRKFHLVPVPGEEKEMEWDNRFTIVRPTKGHMVHFLSTAGA